MQKLTEAGRHPERLAAGKLSGNGSNSGYVAIGKAARSMGLAVMLLCGTATTHSETLIEFHGPPFQDAVGFDAVTNSELLIVRSFAASSKLSPTNRGYSQNEVFLKSVKAGTADTAVKDGSYAGFGLFLDIDRDGISDSARLTEFHFRIAGESAGGWLLVQMEQYENPDMGVRVIAQGQFSASYPVFQEVSVPVSIASLYGQFNLGLTKSFPVGGFAIYVYTPVAGAKIWIGGDLRVEGNLSVKDAAPPKLTVNTGKATTKKSKWTLTGEATDFSDIKRVYVTLAGYSRKYPARLNSVPWNDEHPFDEGSVIFRWTAKVPVKVGKHTAKVYAVDGVNRTSAPVKITIERK